MALKDLVADASKLTEEAIEKIVAEYVRYDSSLQTVVFTPSGTALGNEQKVLVYLVALLGWKYVVEDPQNDPTKPADLEQAVGIPGGTLRPILKKLKDSHLVSAPDGHYRVQSANLDAVAKIVSGAKVLNSPKPKSGSKTAIKGSASAGADRNSSVEKGRKSKYSVGDLRGTLENWISEGFFDEPKAIGDVQNRFHERAIIVKQTSLSPLLVRVVRDGLLERKKRNVDGKQLWTYSKS